ncbi:hypothetical protein FQR65_LT04211 [Abscondita terminalis]|nr:hypothetical protein FQR65_LT04211 [Abscondita terminalis]
MEDNKVQVLTKEAEEFLNEYIKKLKIKNPQVTITPGSIRGDNYLGVIGKVEIKSENSVLHWIFKSAIQQETFRSFLPINKAYQREVYVYRKILAEFNRFQEERNVAKPFKSYAKFLTSYLVEPNECLIMEDMKTLGYKLHDRMEPLDYNHVLLVMREYGRFHALSFALRDQKPDLFKEISENTEEIFFHDDSFINEEMLKAMQNQACKVLDALDPVVHKSAYEKFEKFQKRMIEEAKDAVKSERSGKYSVVCHGDCWINNFLFRYGNTKNSNSPTNLCILDWQLCRLGSPVLDLSYFIFSSTDKQFRDKFYDEMIREYYNSLCTFLTELGSNPDELFPFAVLKEHLKTFSVFGLYMTVQVLFLILSDHEEIPDMHNFKSEDEALEKMNYTTKNIDKYNSRVRGVVTDFDKLGYYF